FVLGNNQKAFDTFKLEAVKQIQIVLCFGCVEIEIGQDHDVILLGLMTQRGFTGQAFRFLIQLKTVISGLWTEDTSAATEQRVLDASLPGSTGTFLAVQLPGRPRNLIPLLGLG